MPYGMRNNWLRKLLNSCIERKSSLTNLTTANVLIHFNACMILTSTLYDGMHFISFDGKSRQ